MVVEPSPSVSRTIKLLVAVSVCDIVTPEWVDACRAADQFVPVGAYLLGECTVSSKAPRERQSGERWVRGGGAGVERRGARERRAEQEGSARERAERMPTDASEAGPLGLDTPAPRHLRESKSLGTPPRRARAPPPRPACAAAPSTSPRPPLRTPTSSKSSSRRPGGRRPACLGCPPPLSSAV